MLKRLFDVLVSILSLIFLLPFLPFIIMAILIDDGFPIFVKIPRVSEGKIINVYKFRSMVVGASKLKKDLMDLNERSDGPFFKIKDDPRLTKVGKFLRKIRIDEFPQFINVLKGELSVVGPRPHEPEEVEKYPLDFKDVPLYKAGITGLSQVNGASGLNYLEEMKLDKYYVDNQSFWLDLKIIFKSVWVFFSDPTGV
jgi:lipopolysaccharide/colanic/teichoic acid biosynthesis glycosyltransferase